MLFSEIGLTAELLRAVKDQGYKEATPIQEKAIPLVLEGNDVLAGAQTGTGKTAGFVLPILQRLQTSQPKGRFRRIRVLILTPTRELAAQVSESVRIYGRYLPFKAAVIFGGVGIRPQIAKLRKGVDIVVATPGRLLDHMQQGTIRLDGVETLVLDEGDRMLDMGFIRDIRKILKAMPAQRQNLLFSATFSQDIRQLANELLNAPTEVQVARRNTAAELVSQVVHPVDRARKRDLLAHLIGTGNWRQVLVFTRTKHGANRLSQQLARDGLSSTAIHGNKSQAARTRALADFKKGRVRILVATDVAARGLDIERLPYVVNFELPHVSEDYVHRIGRTGRAGLDGKAVSLVCVDERRLLAGIERLLKRNIEQVIIPGYEPDSKIRPEPIFTGRQQRPAAGKRFGGPARGGRPSGRPGAPQGNRRQGPAAGERRHGGQGHGGNANEWSDDRRHGASSGAGRPTGPARGRRPNAPQGGKRYGGPAGGERPGGTSGGGYAAAGGGRSHGPAGGGQPGGSKPRRRRPNGPAGGGRPGAPAGGGRPSSGRRPSGPGGRRRTG